MKLFMKTGLLSLVLSIVGIFVASPTASAATSPTLSALTGYSVLGGSAVTCTGLTTTTGSVGVSPGTSITGFPSPCTAGGGTHSNDASAIAAQAEALATFGTLAQPCDFSYGAQDLTLISPLVPGVYCSSSSFSLSGNLTLSSSTGVYIFRTVTTLIASPGSSVTGGDPCNVWWRVGSSTTLDTTSSFIGTLISQNGINAINTNGTLNGRFISLSAGTVTLDANVITGPICTTPAPTTTGGGETTTPGLPNTGLSPQQQSTPWWGVPVVMLTSSASIYLIQKKIKTTSER
ncbi:MAG: ice-binding family protein [bacterium]|nr:ice-binding family protein [bacterium]